MKKLYILLTACLLTAATQAQTLFNLTVGNETYFSAPGSSIVSAPGWDNDPILSQQLAFEFPFHGKKYTEFHISPNGNIYFGNDPLTSVIDPFGCDLYDNPNDDDTAMIRVVNLGTGSNHVKVIEWQNARFKQGEADDVANFQIRLHESGNVTFVYGKIVASAGAFGSQSGPFCGIWDDISGTYLFLHDDPSNPAQQRSFSLPFPNLSGTPGEGTTYSLSQDINSVKSANVFPLYIYPNPASNLVTVSAKDGFEQEIEIYNANGQAITLPIRHYENSIELDTRILGQGIYFIQMKDQGSVYRQKLIIQR